MKQTSRVFACWEALYDVLNESNWSPHPSTGELPTIVFGDTTDPTNDMVIVEGVPADAPTQEWATMGSPSQDEQFVLRVLVGSNVPGLTQAEVFARVADLADVVQAALRDQTTGRPAGEFTTTVPGVLWHRVGRIAPQLYAGPEGYGAYAEIDITFRVRL